jgi:late competence protein required for DNA uptake (superfamily II DNA/RNA helicase)
MTCAHCGNDDATLLERDPLGWLYCVVCAMVTWVGPQEACRWR